MKKYLNPEMTVELLGNEDILTMSTGLTNVTGLDFLDDFVVEEV